MTKIRKIVQNRAVSEDNDQVEKAEDDEQSKQDSEREVSEEEEQQLNQDNEEDDDSEDESRDENPKIQQQKDDDAVALSPNKNVKVGGGEASGVKTRLFTKIFKDEDELLLLKSFINFKRETGVDDRNTFLHAIEGKLTLSFPASHTQLREKVRRFKDNYLSQVARGQTAFENPHQEMIYRLSHEAFGPGDDQQNDDEMESDDEMVEQAKEVDHADYWTLYPKLCRYIESDAMVHFLAAYDVKEFVKMLVLKLGEKKVKELEEEWKEISVMEVQLYAKRLQVLSKQAKAVADVLRKSKSKVIN